jgi:hypothetical protein
MKVRIDAQEGITDEMRAEFREYARQLGKLGAGKA